MQKINQGFLIAGVLLLTAGLLFPWVTLAPHAARQQNRQQIVQLLASPQLPQTIQAKLNEYALHSQMTEQDLLAVLERGAHGRNYAVIESHSRLHVWHLLLLDVVWLSKGLLVLLLLWYLVSALFVVQTFRPSPAPLDPDDEGSYPEQRSIQAKTPPLPVTAVLLLFFFLRLPYWDTMGYVGEWSMSLLDVLVGGRVAFAPRLLIPAGLLLIMLSNVDSWLNGRRKNIVDDIGEYE